MSKDLIVDGNGMINFSSNEEKLSLGDILTAKFHQHGPDLPPALYLTPAHLAPLRARTMTAEKIAECGKALAEDLRLRHDGDAIHLNEVCDEFNCARNIGHAIIRAAANRVRRFFEVVDDAASSSFMRIPTLSCQSLVIGKTHFGLVNAARPDAVKFTTGDRFVVEFSEDDCDKVILTRTHRAATSSTSSANVEGQNG